MLNRQRRNCLQHGMVKCECGTIMDQCRCKGAKPVGFIHCIHRQTPDELFEELVRTAAGGHEEHPARMVWACQRIGKAWKKKPDDVFLEVKAKLKDRTGMSRLPGTAVDLRTN